MSLLLQPLKIGKLTAKNRIETSPAQPFLCTENGLPTQAFIDYNRTLARGGAGIVTIGDSPVNAAYASEAHYVVNLSTNDVVNGLLQSSDAVHRYGALASIELNLRAEYLPADLSKDDIKRLIDDFASAARRCKEAEMDMVLVHGGHGHVVASFASPLMNKRSDEYGCDCWENRTRFAREVLEAVRAEIGPSMAIEYRISGDELHEGGVHLEDAVTFAKYIEKQIDMIHVSSGNMYSPVSGLYMIPPCYVERGRNIPLAKRFKEELSIPVCTVGGMNFELAEKTLESGSADMIAMIRSLIADPELPNKLRYDQAEAIRPCIRCMRCVGTGDPHEYSKPIRCSVNPTVGRATDLNLLVPPQKSRTVAIVGGGVGGMQSALCAAERGHKAILFEKSDRLGGNLNIASAPDFKADLKAYTDYVIRQVESSDQIEVRLNTAATPDMIRALNADAVIVAIGSDPFFPKVPGIEKTAFAGDYMLGKKELGQHVVIVGGGHVGLETALFVSETCQDVTVLDMLPFELFGKDCIGSTRPVLLGMLQERGVKFVDKVSLADVEDGGCHVKDEKGELRFLEADTMVMAAGFRARAAEADSFVGTAPEYFKVGDVVNGIGNVKIAVHGAFDSIYSLR